MGRNHPPMTPPYDQQQHRAAAQTERHHPGWVVLWGTHTRLYWGFPRFQATGPANDIPTRLLAPPDSMARVRKTLQLLVHCLRDGIEAAWGFAASAADG